MKTKPKPKKKLAVLPPITPGIVLMSLDVSSSATGWCVAKCNGTPSPEIVGFGVIKPPSGWDAVRRVGRMQEEIAAMLDQWCVDLVIMEWQSCLNTSKRIQGLATLGQAQGAIRQFISTTHRVELCSERVWTRHGGKNLRKDKRCELVKIAVPSYAKRLTDNPRFDVGMDCADSIGLLLYRISL